MIKVLRVSERPDLVSALEAAVAESFPRFFLFDRLWNELFPRILEDFADLQLLFVDEGRPVGMLNSVAFRWDGTVADLPPGEHPVMMRSIDEHAEGIPPNTSCGIQVVLLPEHVGTGLATTVMEAARGEAGDGVFEHRVSPIRPLLKDRYPLATIEQYCGWTTAEGEPFDPWLRMQQRQGGEVLSICDDSLVMDGTVAEWEDWCEMAFPESGTYVIDGGQFPLVIDREADRGRYSEAHVWMRYA